MFFRKEISRLLQKVFQKKYTIEKRAGFLNFFEREKDQTHRLILNQKNFNHNVVYRLFKMNHLLTVLNIMKQGCYMVSIDLADRTTKFLHNTWIKSTCNFFSKTI